jgi:antirestriction protein
MEELKMTNLTKMEQLLEGLKMIGGWQLEVIENAGLETDELEYIAEHVSDLDEFAKKIEDNDYRIYHVSHHSYSELAEQLETEGVLDIQHIIKDNDFYFDYDQLSHDMDYSGDWSEMAFNNAREIVDGHNDYIDHLSVELKERIKAYWEDMITDDDKQLIDDLHEWIMENEQTEEWKRDWMEEIVTCSDGEWLARYFDYETFGRDLVYDGQFYETENGFIEIL